MTATDAALLPDKDDKPVEPPTVMLGGSPLLDLQDVRDKLRAMFYGIAGAGKTYTAGTAALVPEMCPVILIDFGGGEYRTLKTLQRDHPEVKLQIKRVSPLERIVNGEIKPLHGKNVWPRAEEIMEAIALGRERGNLEVGTLIIDTLTAAYDYAMEWWLAQEYAKDHDRDIDLPGAAGGRDDFGRDWNKARSVLRRMVKGYKDLGTHIIFTAHDKDMKDKTSPRMLNVPGFPGALVNDLPGYFDEVYYMYSRETGEKDPETKEPIMERRIQCQPTNARPVVKSRGGLPMVVQAPTVRKIVDLAEIPLS